MAPAARARAQVLLHVKRSDKDTFLFDTPAASEVDTVVRELVRVQNLRGKANRLAEAASQLAMYGPMKLPEQQGLDDSTPLLEDYDVQKACRSRARRRTAPTTGRTRRRSGRATRRRTTWRR